MKKIYIILTQTGTLMAKTLKKITKDRFNHSSICLKDDFKEFYSFGRKYSYLMLPGGFVIETVFTRVFGRFKEVPCLILEKEITDTQYEEINKIINDFKENSHKYSYAIISLLFANTHFSFVRKNKFFCSQFVATMLNNIGIDTPKVPEHMHPVDFINIDGIKIIYDGDLKKWRM